MDNFDYPEVLRPRLWELVPSCVGQCVGIIQDYFATILVTTKLQPYVRVSNLSFERSSPIDKSTAERDMNVAVSNAIPFLPFFRFLFSPSITYSIYIYICI